MKTRTKEEVKSIVQDFEGGMRTAEICIKHGISESGFARLLKAELGFVSTKRKSHIQKLEKKVADQEKQIELLKAALKKY